MKRLITLVICITILVSVAWAVPITVTIQGEIKQNQTLRILQYDIEQLIYNYYWRGEEIDEINVIIISQGGSLTESLAIFNYLTSLKKQPSNSPVYPKIVKIHTTANSICMSGAMIVLQAGDKRSAQKYTSMMLHSPLLPINLEEDEMYASIDVLEQVTENMIRDNDLMIKLFADRMGVSEESLYKYFGMTIDKKGKIIYSAKMFFFGYKVGNTLVTPAFHALELGFIDVVIGDPISYHKKSFNQQTYEHIERARKKWETENE